MILGLSMFLSTFPFFRDRSARRLDSRLRGPRSHFLCDGEAGYTFEGLVTNFYWFVESFNFETFVVFLVLPRPECQLAGLASPRRSHLVFWSDGKAGWTLEDFVAKIYFILKDFISLDLFNFSFVQGRNASRGEPAKKRREGRLLTSKTRWWLFWRTTAIGLTTRPLVPASSLLEPLVLPRGLRLSLFRRLKPTGRI